MKTIKYYLVAFFLSVAFVSCEKEEKLVDEDPTNVTSTNSKGEILEQFTPNQANWKTLSEKPLKVKSITSHAPDGIGWIKKQQWEDGKWDGKTIYDPRKMSRAKFVKALFPHSDVLRGIHQLYYKHKPFKDEKNPTKAEVDEWHRICINHLRALVGYTEDKYKVQKDHCMFIRALWGDEYANTKKWDKYIDKYPCKKAKKRNPHCGASFVPSKQDQVPYLPKGFDGVCKAGQGAEGISSAAKSDIPWSIKWTRPIRDFLLAEGFWGGHVGPWFNRTKFGFSFWDSDIKNQGSIAVLRAKWTGQRIPDKYKNPKK